MAFVAPDDLSNHLGERLHDGCEPALALDEGRLVEMEHGVVGAVDPADAHQE